MCVGVTLELLSVSFQIVFKYKSSMQWHFKLTLLLCRHYAAFVKCAAFVMRVQNYRCSEDTIQQMALNNYWHFTSRPTSSDWSSHPPMSQSHFPSSNGFPSSGDFSSSDYSGSMSDRDTATMDPSLYSSTDRRVTPSDQYSSSDHHGTTPELYSSFSDRDSASSYYGDSSAPSYSDHSSASDYGGGSYETSLPYICMGELCSLSCPWCKQNKYTTQ